MIYGSILYALPYIKKQRKKVQILIFQNKEHNTEISPKSMSLNCQ